MKEGGREKLLNFFSPDLKNELKRGVAIKVEIYTKIRKKYKQQLQCLYFSHTLYTCRESASG